MFVVSRDAVHKQESWPPVKVCLLQEQVVGTGANESKCERKKKLERSRLKS